MSREKWIGHIAMFVCVFIFGLNIPIAKSVLGVWVKPMGLAMLRIGFAVVALWTTSLFLRREPVQRRGDYLLFIVGGFLGMSFNQITFVVGLDYTTPVYAAILAITTPMFTMFLSSLILKEPITWKKSLGVAIGATGAIFIILRGSGGFGGGSMLGNILCVVSSFSYALYVVLMRPITMRYTPVTLMKWMFLAAFFFTLPFGILGLSESRILIEAAPLNTYLSLFFVMFMATYVTYLLIPVGLKRIRPTTVTTYNYVQPLVASFAAITTGQDSLTWDKAVAAIIIFIGVYFVTSSKSLADLEKEKKQQTPEP